MDPDIPPLCESIERLCDSLRSLRRENPQLFFDHPVEGLLRRLESALESFYRAKASDTPTEEQNASHTPLGPEKEPLT